MSWILVDSLPEKPVQVEESSTTSFVAELLVSCVGFTQAESDENVIEVVDPAVPTQRSLTFWGLSFWPLQISHTVEVVNGGRPN